MDLAVTASETGSEVRNVRLLVEYDGSGFSGFQKQPDRRTVQGVMEECIAALTGSVRQVVGAGRTDAGVHARGQVVNVCLPVELPLERVAVALNTKLPSDLVILAADEVALDFHSRYSAVSRTYEYTIRNNARLSALEARYTWQVPVMLDVQCMSVLCDGMVGTHNFSAFGTPEKGRSPCRDLITCEIRISGCYILIRIQANAFLRHMARGIVGAVAEVGMGHIQAQEVLMALQTGATQPMFPMAPPEGLCLVSVEY